MTIPVQKMIGAYKDNMDYQSKGGSTSSSRAAAQDKNQSKESNSDFAKVLRKTMERSNHHN